MIWLFLLACSDGVFEEVEQTLGRNCFTCHGPTLERGDLDMATDFPASIVGVPSSQADMALVEPGDHRFSYLFHKANGTQSLAFGAGVSMPIGGELTQEELDLIALWIDLGARDR